MQKKQKYWIIAEIRRRPANRPRGRKRRRSGRWRGETNPPATDFPASVPKPHRIRPQWPCPPPLLPTPATRNASRPARSLKKLSCRRARLQGKPPPPTAQG